MNPAPTPPKSLVVLTRFSSKEFLRGLLQSRLQKVIIITGWLYGWAPLYSHLYLTLDVFLFQLWLVCSGGSVEGTHTRHHCQEWCLILFKEQDFHGPGKAVVASLHTNPSTGRLYFWVCHFVFLILGRSAGPNSDKHVISPYNKDCASMIVIDTQSCTHRSRE